ncbi:MAG: serine/threonine protein kinase [Candidatus Obscuribacterales bacterium]|nr:serine/threonine protein kinase [Candidatus Obscuribacterales bacterium]
MSIDPNSTQSDYENNAQSVGSPFEIGQVLGGKYEIVSLLGRGGMGAVYRVRHKLLNVELALKTLDSQRLSDASSSRRFQTEAKAAFSLKHPNLVKVHDFGVLENGHPFLVMDLVQGRTLQSLIKERGQLSLEELEPIFSQLCFGLAHAHHHQVVHRDIKPANIMIVDEMKRTDEGSVKILDFGIAKIVNQDRGEMDALTQTGEIFGSPYYMSPEQCAGETIDQRSDVYSLGCVLFEAITGTPPLVGTNSLRTMMLHVNEKAPSLKEATLGTEFPPAIEKIVAKMLAKSPADRYSDLGMVAIELHRACTRPSADVFHLEDDSLDSEKSARRRTVAFTPLQLAGLIVAVSFVSVAVTIMVCRHLRVQSNDSAAAAQKKVAIRNDWLGANNIKNTGTRHRQGKIEEYRKSFEKVSRIELVPYVEGGESKRKIVFPELRCGATRHGAPDLDGTRGIDKVVAAKTRIYPASGPIIFNVNEDLDEFALPNYFIYDKIDPSIFSGLDLETIPYANRDVIIPDDELSNVRPGVDHLFKIISKWTNLRFVNFRDVEVRSELLRSLNDCKQLTYLVLHTPKYDPVYLSRQPFFKRLNKLIAIHGDVSPMLKALSHTHTIKQLWIGDHATFTPEAAISLRQCSHIDFFCLSQTGYTDAVARALSNLTNVSRISFTRGTLKPAQKAMFEKNWRLLDVGENPNYARAEHFAPRTVWR